MFRMIKRTRKILAMIILFITLFGIMQPTILAVNQVISGSGSDKFIARQYASRIKTTDAANGGEYGIIARRLIMKNAGWQFGNGDGIVVFCAQNGVHFKTGESYDGNYYIPTDDDIKRASKVAYCGWYQSRGQYRLRWSIRK